MNKNLRRLRSSATLRQMLGGVRICRDELIAPLFVREGDAKPAPIASMPGQFQHSVASGLKAVKQLADAGLKAVLLFGLGKNKDAAGSGAWDDSAAVQRLTAAVKRELPAMLVITDVCLCEYTDHGHCGVLHKRRDGSMDVDNDATLALLAKTALSHAKAGADIVAPSAMMDGQVGAIRAALDEAGFGETAIMSYAVKFASSFYGPFREAAQSKPQFGDRRTYQMDYRSPAQASLEAAADIEQGADIIMVKPAGPYLDVIAKVRQSTNLPLAAYQVSGEYSAIKASAKMGWLDERDAVIETVTAIKRAGADLIITYFAQQLASWLG